ncbi:hypothetical protein BS78_03G127300 [Paspalum vaginatum]|nr:hypothetical protein BS78_03G127300 [Paspalum vaginatum]
MAKASLQDVTSFFPLNFFPPPTHADPTLTCFHLTSPLQGGTARLTSLRSTNNYRNSSNNYQRTEIVTSPCGAEEQIPPCLVEQRKRIRASRPRHPFSRRRRLPHAPNGAPQLRRGFDRSGGRNKNDAVDQHQHAMLTSTAKHQGFLRGSRTNRRRIQRVVAAVLSQETPVRRSTRSQIDSRSATPDPTTVSETRGSQPAQRKANRFPRKDRIETK